MRECAAPPGEVEWHKEFAQENEFVWAGETTNVSLKRTAGKMIERWGRGTGKKAKKYGAYHTSRTSTHYTGYVTIGKLDTKPTKGHSRKERNQK